MVVLPTHIHTQSCCCLVVEIGDIGATGRLTFRQDGRRRGYIVDVLGLGRRGLEQVSSIFSLFYFHQFLPTQFIESLVSMFA